MTARPEASIEEMATWADGLMASRAPNLVIGDDYLRRWWVIPRNGWQNVYLHLFLHDDYDAALHDHPWDNTSIILRGRCIEETPHDMISREAGDIVHRKATDAHRIKLINNEPMLTLFFTGPVVRDWGFHCPSGWRSWQEFIGKGNYGMLGRICE